MKQTSIIAVLICTMSVLSVLADGTAKEIKKHGKKAFSDRVAQLGGFVTYPNSQKGCVAFIDTQKEVDVKGAFDEVFAHIRRQIPIKLNYLKSQPGEPIKLKTEAKADFAIIIVHDQKLPPSMIVPEEKYALVNLAKYKKAIKLPQDDALLKKRCAKAVLKAYMLLCGGCASKYPGHVGTAQTAQDLDLTHDKLPIDIQDSMKKYLSAAGVTPIRRTIYRKACQEGWAPAPTNDIQKAIWDKVRATPKNPMKIEFDPKKGR